MPTMRGNIHEGRSVGRRCQARRQLAERSRISPAGFATPTYPACGCSLLSDRQGCVSWYACAIVPVLRAQAVCRWRCGRASFSGLLLAQIPSWLLFAERPQSQPSTRRSCQAHWWRIWDAWPPSHYYARAALLGLRRALSAVTRRVWIAGVRPQGGHSERSGVRGAGWQFTAGDSRARSRLTPCATQR